MFSKVLASFGAGAAKVDARLLDHAVRPGGALRGEVHLIGGQVDQEVDSLGVTLLARVDTPEGPRDLPFQEVNLAGRELVRAGSRLTVPFEVRLPWEAPITSVLGKHLTGMAVGLQTKLKLAGAVVDPHDVDAVSVEPLPPQHRVLDALSRLGFTFRAANLERERIDGVDQQLPFYQEVTFAPSPAFAAAFTEVAVTFLAGPQQVRVVLDVVKKVRVVKGGGLGQRGVSTVGSFIVAANEVGRSDWEQRIEGWLRQVAAPRGIFD
ncbi:sporulation protein [Actinokineospora auranticolor]|uniref:Sporulation-control protein n=1 Tax=Actinokineospora auranticolor TaxID=155976 RepID=A0A2S6GHF0_9PSEU|nr:sporulation protein [Actinokineospora auranticolor]PPK64623.1 sporulation-control protein [Actinokineospora auranticolor]